MDCSATTAVSYSLSNMEKKFGEVQMSSSWYMQTNRQTDRQTHHNTQHHHQSAVKTEPPNRLFNSFVYYSMATEVQRVTWSGKWCLWTNYRAVITKLLIILQHDVHNYYHSDAGSGAKYCNKYVCLSVSHTANLYLSFVYATCGHGSVLLSEIRQVLPVLWMTSHSYSMGPMGQNQAWRLFQ